MKTQLSPREWEKLSAYLDGQLSITERTRLETRLQTNTDLQAALVQLRQTRAVIRSLPTLRAPRNYTLSAQMVRTRKPVPRIYPALRFATVVATLLFCLVVAGDFLVPRPLNAPSPQMAAPANQTSVAMAPESAQNLTSTPLAEDQTELQSSQPLQKSLIVSGTISETEKSGAPASSLSALPGAAAESTEAPPRLGGEGETTLQTTPTPASPESFIAPEEPATETNPSRGIDPLRVLEIVLGVVAVGTGLATFAIQRGSGG